MKSEDLVYSEFLHLYEQFGSYRALSKHLGFSIGYLHDVMEGRRAIAGKLAKKLGYKVHREVEVTRTYEPINEKK